MRRNLSLLAFLFVSLGAAAGAAPAVIPVQGVLSDALGQPLTGTRRLTFRLYTSASAPLGEAVFTEEATVTLSQGFFSTHLGSSGTPPFTLSLFRDHPVLYLGVTVEGDPGELMPRFELGTAPYAAYAELAGEAATLQGLSSEDFATKTHNHSFQSLLDVPPGLADGDDDTLAGLSCIPGDVPVKTPAGWGCGSGSAGLISDANVAPGANISPTKISGTAWTATNDGATSGLDADRLDGMDSTAFAATTHSHPFSSLTGIPQDLTDGDNDSFAALGCGFGQAPVKDANGNWSCATPWTAANDGPGSGLSADNLDGLESNAILVTKSRIYTRGVEGPVVSAGLFGWSYVTCDDTNDVGMNCSCGGDETPGPAGTSISPKGHVYETFLLTRPSGKDVCECGIVNEGSVALYPYSVVTCLDVSVAN